MGEIIGNNDQVTISVSDLVPPSNLATIDKDGNVGNTFSKDQFNEKFQNKSDDLDEKIAEIKAQVETDFQGTLKPTDPAPTADGSYKPEVLSADPGTNYPNAGNLKAMEGYDTTFYKKGAVWTKSEVKIPGSTAKQTFDKTDNVSPATMKAAADRFDPGITVLNSFVSAQKTEETEIIMPLSGEINGAYLSTSATQVSEPDSANGGITMAELSGYDNIVIRGNTASLGAGCLYLAKIMPGGTRVNIKVGGNNAEFTHVIDKTAQQYIYSRYKGSTSVPLKTQFLKTRLVPDIKVDAVKDMIEPTRVVLDSFVNPTETIWEEIVMPYSGETDGQYLDSNKNALPAATCAWGMIPNTEFGTEWSMIKVVGNFNLLGTNGLHLYRYRPSGTTPNLLVGLKGASAEYIYNIDSTYTGFGYSRVKGELKFYKGKVVKVTPTLDSVKNFMLANSAKSRHRFIDAYTEYNVKASNTAAVNTTNLNEAIKAAYNDRVPVMLPTGNIKHNGIEYMPGVQIYGTGPGTALWNEGGTYGIRCLDPYNTNEYRQGGGLYNLVLYGNNVADVGIDFRNMFFIDFRSVIFMKFKVWSVRLTGVMGHTFDYCDVQDAGFNILTSDQSAAGYMQANLNQYNFVYFQKIPGLAVDIDRAANLTFRSCNFERCGTTGNTNTGGVRATRLSPGGEGVDITFENCWSETLMGPFLQVSNSNGVIVINNTTVGNAGNTSANNIINNGCKLLLSGSTRILGSTTGVRTQNTGETRVSGFVRVNTHVEESGGIYKTAQYV